MQIRVLKYTSGEMHCARWWPVLPHRKQVFAGRMVEMTTVSPHGTDHIFDVSLLKKELEMTPLPRLLLEAVVVAAVFVVIFFAVHIASMCVWHDEAMRNHWLLGAQVAVSAALFHVLFEVTGLNAWYCRHYPAGAS